MNLCRKNLSCVQCFSSWQEAFSEASRNTFVSETLTFCAFLSVFYRKQKPRSSPTPFFYSHFGLQLSSPFFQLSICSVLCAWNAWERTRSFSLRACSSYHHYTQNQCRTSKKFTRSIFWGTAIEYSSQLKILLISLVLFPVFSEKVLSRSHAESVIKFLKERCLHINLFRLRTKTVKDCASALQSSLSSSEMSSSHEFRVTTALLNTVMLVIYAQGLCEILLSYQGIVFSHLQPVLSPGFS